MGIKALGKCCAESILIILGIMIVKVTVLLLVCGITGGSAACPKNSIWTLAQDFSDVCNPDPVDSEATKSCGCFCQGSFRRNPDPNSIGYCIPSSDCPSPIFSKTYTQADWGCPR